MNDNETRQITPRSAVTQFNSQPPHQSPKLQKFLTQLCFNQSEPTSASHLPHPAIPLSPFPLSSQSTSLPTSPHSPVRSTRPRGGRAHSLAGVAAAPLSHRVGEVLWVRQRQVVQRLGLGEVAARLETQRRSAQRRDVAVVEHCRWRGGTVRSGDGRVQTAATLPRPRSERGGRVVSRYERLAVDGSGNGSGRPRTDC